MIYAGDFPSREQPARLPIAISRDVTPTALRVLKVLLEECNLTRAARRLNLTPSGVSRILARLRIVFNDPLLVHAGSGFRPTGYARALDPHLAAVLGEFERLLQPVATHPSEFRRSVRLGISPYAANLEIERAVLGIMQEAPGIVFRLHHLPGESLDALETGALDLAVSLARSEASTLYATSLDAGAWVCVMRPGHPLAQSMTAADYFEARHLTMIHAGAAYEPVDEALGDGRRRIAWWSLSQASAAMVLADSDLLLTVPRWVAEPLLRMAPLVAVPVPAVSLPPARSSLFWHARVHNAPLFKWVRRRLLDILRARSGVS